MPSPRRSGSGPGGGGGPTVARIALGLGAFLVLSTCIRAIPGSFPDPDDVGPDIGPASPVPGGSPAAPGFRVERAGPAPDGPDGWSAFLAPGGMFTMLGPGRPEQRVSGRGGTYTFGPVSGVTFVAEVRRTREPSGRSLLERETALFLDDLGAIERSRRWTQDAGTLVLDVDARRADTRVRIRTFVDRRLLYRASVTWKGPSADATSIDAFLLGLAAGAPT